MFKRLPETPIAVRKVYHSRDRISVMAAIRIGLGDRKAIEEQTKVWNKTVVDRSAELTEWSKVLGKLKIPIYIYANNHYAGYSPATVDMFCNLWRRRGPEVTARYRVAEQGQLFK